MYEPHNRELIEVREIDPEWRDHQPSWTVTLIIGFSPAVIFGGIGYWVNGTLELLEIAALGSVLLCVYLRWIQPRYEHLSTYDD
jgi:hypothetical protein